MAEGTIKRMTDRGFGFITGEQGGDIFFHRSELVGVGYNALREGQEVEYDTSKGRDGRAQAVKVRLPQPRAAAPAAAPAAKPEPAPEPAKEELTQPAGGEEAEEDKPLSGEEEE